MAVGAKVTPEELKKRMQPTHLVPSPEELKEQIAEKEQVEAEKAEADAEETPITDPRLEKEYTFKIDFTDPRGKRWQGTFTNKILSIRERQTSGMIRTQLGGGISVESLDPMTNMINTALAHMTYSLIKTPDWAKDLMTLESIPLLQEIYAEVDSHESIFHGWIKPAAQGKEAAS